MASGKVTITNILLDLDGTLADTAPDLARALNDLLLETGRTPLAYADIRPMVSHGGIHMIREAFGMQPSHPDFDGLRSRFLDSYLAHIADETRLFDGMQELLAWIEERGLTWGIVTNKMERLTMPLLDALQLNDRASCVVCGDTVAHSKPHPAPMLHACSLTGKAPEQTLYLGDAEKDVIAGRRAGMYTLVALYGYIHGSEDPASWGADGLVDSPGQAREWIEDGSYLSPA